MFPTLTERDAGAALAIRTSTAWWCNGSTGDFDSPSHGSNPCRAAIRRAVRARLAHGLRPAYTNEINALVAEARRMALSKGRSPASKGACVVYFLRLRSGTLYIDAPENLEQRLEDHSSGQACRTTQRDSPVSFLRLELYVSFSEARTREAQLKRWSRGKKEALIESDFKTLRALSQSCESVKLPNKQN